MSSSSESETSSYPGDDTVEQFQVVEESGTKCATITCRRWLIPSVDGMERKYYWHPGAPSDRQNIDAARNKAKPKIAHIVVDEGRKITLNWTRVEYDSIIFQSNSFRKTVQYYNNCSESEYASPEKKRAKEKKEKKFRKQIRSTAGSARMDIKTVKRKLQLGISSTKLPKDKIIENNQESTAAIIPSPAIELEDFIPSAHAEDLPSEKTLSNDNHDCRDTPNGNKDCLDDAEEVIISTSPENLFSASFTEKEIIQTTPILMPTPVANSSSGQLFRNQISGPTPSSNNTPCTSTNTLTTGAPVTLEIIARKMDNTSARITRIERTQAIIIDQIKRVNERLDAIVHLDASAVGDAVIGELRGLFPISTKAGFEDLEERLHNDAGFRNKFCQYIKKLEDLNKDETNRKDAIERMLECLFSKSIVDFGNWSGLRENEEKKKTLCCVPFKDSTCFSIFLEKMVASEKQKVIVYHVVQEWIRNKRGTKVKKIRVTKLDGKNEEPNAKKKKSVENSTPPSTPGQLSSSNNILLRRSPRTPRSVIQ